MEAEVQVLVQLLWDTLTSITKDTDCCNKGQACTSSLCRLQDDENWESTPLDAKVNVFYNPSKHYAITANPREFVEIKYHPGPGEQNLWGCGVSTVHQPSVATPVRDAEAAAAKRRRAASSTHLLMYCLNSHTTFLTAASLHHTQAQITSVGGKTLRSSNADAAASPSSSPRIACAVVWRIETQKRITGLTRWGF